MKNNELYLPLKAKLERKQSKQRYLHSVSVGDWAAKLGKKYGWNVERARLAGLLHDYAKEWSPRKLRRYVQRHKIAVPCLDFIIENSPNMLHAYVSSHFVGKKGWVRSAKDLQAISSHTLGREKMGLEEKILYIADFSAPGRTYSSAKIIRRKAMINLDEAFRETLAFKLSEQLRRAKKIHPLPILVWNSFVGRNKK